VFARIARLSTIAITDRHDRRHARRYLRYA
jgi:hypothetical protein